MRKLFTLLLAVSVFFTSCLRDNTSSVDVEPGLRIYASTYYQQNLDKDIAEIAFKLNVLLETVEAQRAVSSNPSAITINNVKVTIPADDDDADDEETELKNLLFSNNTVQEQGSGIYTITFTEGVYPTNDYNRSGTITVNTDGKLLSEMDQGETWTVSGGSNLVVIIDGNNFTANYPDFIIEAEGDYKWSFFGTSKATLPSPYDNGVYTATWDFSYTVAQSFAYGLDFDNVWNSVFLLDGEGEGVPVGMSGKYSYLAKNLKYKPACRSILIYGGAEYSYIQHVVSDEEYPDKAVKYLWTELATDKCGAMMTIGYNNYTYSITYYSES